MAFEHIVDRESKFGTIVFDSINIHEPPQPRQDDIRGRLDEIGHFQSTETVHLYINSHTYKSV